nr:MAG TPA: hypothetical protein [Caudoviricetes sp.]
MTIIDDIKAINKDIKKVSFGPHQVVRAKYWIRKLSNIYPDYIFKGDLTEDGRNIKIVYWLKVVY